MQTAIFPVRLGKAQRDLIKHTQKVTGLTGSEVIRQCIDLGAPQLVNKIGRPRRSLGDLAKSLGTVLKQRNREVFKPR